MISSGASADGVWAIPGGRPRMIERRCSGLRGPAYAARPARPGLRGPAISLGLLGCIVVVLSCRTSDREGMEVAE